MPSMHARRRGLWIVLLCAGCGAADARDGSPASAPGSMAPTGDAALDRLVGRCDASCAPDERLALAQHLTERARARQLEALDAAERVQTEPDAVARQQARAREQAASRDAARDGERALALLRAIAEDATVPPPRIVETALFELLYALADAHAPDEARAVAERIVRDLPTRPVAAHAWLAIGERAFEGADLERARDAYLAVAGVPGADVGIVVYARYKLGWVHFNLSDFEAARDAFRDVARAQTQPLIAREARRDFVRALVPLDGSPVQDVAEIHGVAQGDTQAAELADRYEQALRDVGLDRRAVAFRAAWR